jgi:CBS domain-containing protein
MLTHPNVHVACVVAEDGRLVGLLGLRELADDIFFHIMPEKFLSEISDLDEVMEFAGKSAMRTASDAMQDPVWVKRGETVREAFKRMHEHKLPGLPVVDEQYHVVAYINLLELLAIGLKRGGEASGKGQSR